MNTVATELLPLSAEDFATLEAWLNARRQSFPETPDWEFCEGFLAALVCCRRSIAPGEYWPRLLGLAADAVPANVSFLWARRWALVEQALDTRVSALDDPAAYQPELGESDDAFAQRWAQGFMAAVTAWPEEWVGPRNAQAQQWREAALKLLRALTLPDTGAPTQHAYEDQQGPPRVSAARMQAVGDAIWAVYNLRETWKSLGPRVETVKHAAVAPGRNDPCHCGSGKKFKKCCG
ncbi:YecA family protein [Hydrogenophaga taeniospiralis]|uniref:YecA/YgfB family protein n=1 Tax=Hydrogenophaga taeniospiralis TaxID=65656 RepID=UPI001CFA79EB|nr:YecA family protein [Hydrogenophaga taeniospiralis]UCU95765.1 UPF0149 family protein [Hydrogenophaga taeniospiralis]